MPVYANVTAAPTQDPDEIRALLVRQVTSPVRWEESIAAMHAAGVTRAFELGAGSVLKGLVKRIADGAVGVSVMPAILRSRPPRRIGRMRHVDPPTTTSAGVLRPEGLARTATLRRVETHPALAA